ncbi:MAG: hypothetical protein KAS30_01670 [Candidatus Diapherotrites archaeon]|nr:hypothetical protein [Candidatus Diapherotrites archaeon]
MDENFKEPIYICLTCKKVIGPIWDDYDNDCGCGDDYEIYRVAPVDEANFIFNHKELKDWAIVGMNHYFKESKKCLFVAMIKGSKCIKAEGDDEEIVFKDLIAQAIKQEQTNE